MSRRTHRLNSLLILACALLLAGCDTGSWNNPYPDDQAQANILYSAFGERPKHFDPARSYSSNEWAFLSQIYEPPLQYHYLKRPAELVPLTANHMPEIRRYDQHGELLAEDADPDQIAYTDYVIELQPGIRYQPHPAFAEDTQGKPLYWPLSEQDLAEVHELRDFPKTGTRELTAADYVYQIKRLAQPKNHSPIAGLMAGYIKGFKEFAGEVKPAYEQLKQESGEKHPWLDLRRFDMSGLEVIDDQTFRIRIQGSYPQFSYWLAMNFFAPMPWEVDRFFSQPGMVERNLTLHWYPVGTGPYWLSENNPNLRMVLERNPNFRGEPYPSDGEPGDAEAGLLDDAGQAMPFIDKVIYSLEKEAIPRWNKFLQGYFDASGVGSDAFDQAVVVGAAGEMTLTEAMRDQGIKLASVVEPTSFYMGFNMLDKVIGGDSERARLLRRAIAIAVDYEEFIAIFQNGRGLAAQGPLPPGIIGYRDGEAGINPYVYDWVDGKPQRKPIAQARELLAQAGYPNGRDAETGEPLILYFESLAAGPDSKPLHNWYVKQFKKLDIQLVIRATDYNRFQEKMLNGKAQIFAWGWHADYPDPENFLFLLHGPNGKVEYKGENAANYANPAFDTLFEQMKNMANGPERQAVIDQAVEILRRDSPWLWGFHPTELSLFHGWYHNVKPHGISKNLLKYRRLDPIERAEKRADWNAPVIWPFVALVIVLALSLIPAIQSYRRRERSSAR